MEKELTFLFVILMLVGASGLLIAAEQNVPAKVGVSEFISVTITPCAGSLDFGNGNPGDENLESSCQTNVTASINVANDPISNKNINVETKGSNFQNVALDVLGVNNIGFDDIWNPSGNATLGTTYQTVTTGVSPSSNSGIWYFMDIPEGQNSGYYTGTLSVKAE